MKQPGIPHLSQHPSLFWKSSKEGSTSLSYLPLENNHFLGDKGSCLQMADLESRSNELLRGLSPAAQHHHFSKGQELIQIYRLMVIKIPSPESR